MEHLTSLPKWEVGTPLSIFAFKIKVYPQQCLQRMLVIGLIPRRRGGGGERAPGIHC